MKLKQLRLMSGLSQENFAKQFNISQNTWSNYENENRAISLDLIKKIAQKFQCPTDYLLDNDQIYDGRIAGALTDERIANGYTLKELSEETKIPLQDLKDYEEGIEPINQFLLMKLCKLYGKSIYQFYVDHEMYDEYIPEIFNENVDKYEAFKIARDNDALLENASITSSENLPVFDDPDIRMLARKSLKDPKMAKKLKGIVEALLKDDEDDD